MTPTAAESFVARDVFVEGLVKGQGSLRVAGRVKGKIAIAGEVTIEAGAFVEGEVKAARITVAPGARLRGDVEFGWSEEEALRDSEAVRDRRSPALNP